MPELTSDAPTPDVSDTGRTPAAPAVTPPGRDWRSVIGMFEDSEFSRLVDAEVEAMRAAEPRPADGEAAA